MPPSRLRILFLIPFLSLVLLAWRPALADQESTAARGDSVVLQPGGGEAFTFDLPAGWRLGSQERSEVGLYLEWTPDDQSVEGWRDLIAIHLYPTLAGLPPSDYLTRMADRLADLCDFLMTTDMIAAPANGFPGARRVLACTRDKASGQGEVTMFRVVTGKEALYVLLRAWRRPAFSAPSIPVTNAELVESRKLLDTALPCRKGASEQPCPSSLAAPSSQPDSKDQPVVVIRSRPEAGRDAAPDVSAKADPAAAPQAGGAAAPPLPPQEPPALARSEASGADGGEAPDPGKAKRLRLLDKLRARGLVTEEAYREKRCAILEE